jgi:hypothetical protein
MLMPCLPVPLVQSSRMAQPSEARVISLEPTGFPSGFFTVHLPSQKSNWRNSVATQAGGRGVGLVLAAGVVCPKAVLPSSRQTKPKQISLFIANCSLGLRGKARARSATEAALISPLEGGRIGEAD